MNGGGVGPRACDATRRHLIGLVVLVLGVATGVRAADPSPDASSEVRVLSGPGAASTVMVRMPPGVHVEDRTPGAKAAAGAVASTGDTFKGDVTVFLSGHRISRPASVEVTDPVVSAVRLFPEGNGTTVVVFVRQPVTYTVSQPSDSGEVRVALKGKARPLKITTTPRGRQKVKRPEPTGKDEVAVDAESLSYDQQTNTITARGGVSLTRGDTILNADEVLYDRTNEVAQARGHVVLTDPQATILGTFAHMNMDDETGWVETADAKLQPTGYSLLAGKLDKLGGPRYSVANGVFTTCECGGLEKPSWSLSAKQTEVELQGTGVAHHATFRLKDVPVLYFPYFVFPAATDRQSGFLFPRLGYSNRRGFQYEQPFFWAISKSTDATFGFDVETAARIGAVGEYRYILSRDVKGEFAGAYYNEHIGGNQSSGTKSADFDSSTPENRFMVAGRHSQPFYGDSKFYLDLFAVSDDNFLRDINTFRFIGGEDVAFRSLRFTTSKAEVLKTWHDGLASVDNTYHQDLIDPQAFTLQRLPNLDVDHSIPILGQRLVARLAGQATDFWREQGFDGVRLDLAPELALPFHYGNLISGSVSGQLRETAYHLFNQNQVALVRSTPTAAFPVVDKDFEKFRAFADGVLPRLDQNRSRELGTVQAELGTSFQRVFDFPHLGLGKVMHTIEPEVQYLYIPQVGLPQDTVVLPSCESVQLVGRRPRPGVNCDATLFSEGFLFDERDAYARRNFLSYGFTSRLLGRAPAAADAKAPTDPPRELIRATIVHGYDISRDIVGNSHQSDVDLGLRVNPTDYLALSYNTTVNLEQLQDRGRSLALTLREPNWKAPEGGHNLQAPTAIGVSYRFIQPNVNEAIGVPANSPQALLFRDDGVNEIDGGLYLRIGNYLGFTFLSRYTLNTTQALNSNGALESTGPHFLERDYLIRLISRCNCWAIDAGVADKFNPDERLFRIQFTLVGLGSIGRGPTRMNYVGVGPLANTAVRRGPAPLGGSIGGLGGY